MEAENKKKSSSSRYSRKLRNWFSNKHQKEEDKQPSYSFYQIQDGAEDDEIDDDYEGDLSLRSVEFDPCILTNNKLRVFVGTWNVGGRSPVGSLAVDLEEWLNLKNAADIYVLGYIRFQEIVPLKTLNVLGAEDQEVARRWNKLIGTALNNKNNNNNNDVGNSNNKYYEEEYMVVGSKKMVGVLISVWVKRGMRRKWGVSGVRVSSVACGALGYLGNKGAVALSMAIQGTTFCFVAAHLASGQNKRDQATRNHQVAHIFKTTCFPAPPTTTAAIKHHYPLTILGHDRIFWFGDLNYRLQLEDKYARQLIRKQDWKGLQEFDQLQKELQGGGVFEGWTEGSIQFAPTYKYSNSGAAPLHTHSGEKHTTPAWCDRILWHGKGVEQLHYIRTESKFSDHRPVSALFSTHIHIFNTTNNSSSTIAPTLLLHPHPGMHNKEDEDRKSTLLSLLTKDIIQAS